MTFTCKNDLREVPINKGNPNFMYTKKCDLKKINFKQKTSLKNGIINLIKWQKKK